MAIDHTKTRPDSQTRKPLRRSWPRIVLHADMDAFYASVEQLDHPELRGRPVLVGPRSGRGVVLTASYEARPFGVGSAMPMAHALRRCPDAIVVPPRFDRYTEISATVMALFRQFSPDVEALSLDEAFLEMTGAEHLFGSPMQMAEQLRGAVAEATGGLQASVGVAHVKYVAKVASGLAKPKGIQVVPPGRAVAWLGAWIVGGHGWMVSDSAFASHGCVQRVAGVSSASSRSPWRRIKRQFRARAWGW